MERAAFGRFADSPTVRSSFAIRMKQICLLGFAVAIAASVVSAIANLPVITGCGFYAHCDVEIAGFDNEIDEQ
ncbi:hypothetical protein [Wenxinia marina]|nr:hypothetical protein [Wenxinia marina]